ncbi:MAG: Gfo/Idh/MocA family oxidoreductase, partial [Eubacteriales bacterium]|nr:Gfo/Idh/MocA family oxidoreductase [Eubacteriales bacterium]
MDFKPVKTAVIGCGVISKIYLENCTKKFKILDIVGCSDIIPERSALRAHEYGIKQMTNSEIYNDPEIELVLNLTYHTSHYTVTKESLMAGKHVYSEKMLANTFDQAKELTEIAEEKGLLYGCAPDTFLGSGLQTARRAIDSGWIGIPIAAEAILIRSYHFERGSADAERHFVYKPGGGIIFDVGCYYLTGLVNLLGPIKRVCGFSVTREANERYFMNSENPDYGKIMKIETPNHTAGVMEFINGTFCPILTTSEGSNFTNRYSIFGTEGTLTLNDPNNFSGNVSIHTKTGTDMTLPVAHAYTENERGLGVADLAYALRMNRKPRAGWECGLHTLEAAHGIVDS